MTDAPPPNGLQPRPDAFHLDASRPSDSVLARVKRGVGIVVGVGVTLLCGMGILGAVIDIGKDPVATTVVGCTLMTGFGLSGALLARRMLRQQAQAKRAPSLQAIREILFAVASQYQGRLTVAELAAALAIAPEPAERALEAAITSGAARLLFSPEGVAVYEFPGLLTAKSEAKEPWEL